MTLPLALELLACEWLAEEGVWSVLFEAEYPGETICRSEVRMPPTQDPEHQLATRALDVLWQALEIEGRPASLVLCADEEGWVVLERGYPAG